MRTGTLLVGTIALLLAGGGRLQAQAGQPAQREPIIGLPCEGCEAVFESLPKELSPLSRIAPKDEPGEPMRIEGTVSDLNGRPVANVIVYAYHTDAHGIYPPDERLRGQAAYRHGRLRGWAKTDEHGRYRFDTIRPASYPSSDTPAHVHMHVIEPGCCTYYVASIHFTDDPLLNAVERRELAEGRGGSGLVEPVHEPNAIWSVTRDIVLGDGIRDYEQQRSGRRDEDEQP